MINDRLSFVKLTIFVSGRNTSLRAWLKTRAPLGCREGPEQRKRCSQASLQALAVTSERRRCFSSILVLRPSLVRAAPFLLPTWHRSNRSSLFGVQDRGHAVHVTLRIF